MPPPGAGSFLRQAWKAYEQSLHRAPLLTQAGTSAVLWSCGDLASQRIEGAHRNDWKRTSTSAMFGGLFIGPVGHMWYQGLESFVAKRLVQGSPRFILTKVALDELVFGPVHVLAFFAFMTYALGGHWQDVKRKVQQDFVATYAAELAFWPAFQIINFKYVPARHNLLVVNLGCLLDATFLCWIQSQEDWTKALPIWLQHKKILKGKASTENVAVTGGGRESNHKGENIA